MTWARQWWGGEEANTFAMLIVMLPMLMAAFGLGVDMTHNTYIKSELQADLDLATVSGAAVTTSVANPDTSTLDRRIDTNAAIATTRNVYAANRDRGVGNLNCLSGNANRCWVEHRAPRVTSRTGIGFGVALEFHVHEQSKNGFLSIVGIPTQDYHLTSTALLRPETR